MNDIVINKIQSIQQCVFRAREEYQSKPEGFAMDFTIQDAALLNILRACEQAIDLVNHILKSIQMGIPTSSAESFDLLQERSVTGGMQGENPTEGDVLISSIDILDVIWRDRRKHE